MAIKYIGDGTEHYPGLPNDDLSDEQWAALPEEVREMLIARKMFRLTGKDKPPPEPEPEPVKASDKAEGPQGKGEG